MDQVIEVARYSPSEGVHHQVHPFPHHLHLYNNVGWSHICDGWATHVMLFWSARGITTFRPLFVSFLSAGAFLVIFLSVMPCILLT